MSHAIATLAGGCFWCIETVFNRLRGVDSAVSGYMGGHTPNPTSGFLLLVPRRETIPLAMSVEEAIKLVVSTGIVVPPDRGPATIPPAHRIGGADKA